jgi:L-fuconolactonase
MFGSKWPVCLLAADYDDAIDAAEQFTVQLNGAEQRQVFGGTVGDWYRISA